MINTDGKEKFVMFSEADGRIFELPESNLVNGKFPTGSKNYISDNAGSDEIRFISDSGAIEHIVKEESILNNVIEVKGGEVRCANKSTKADLKIKSKEDLNAYG